MGDRTKAKGARPKGARITARETALGELRGWILAGEIKPGERIIEQRVAQRLTTSRGPVRDAIRTLEHEGLVVVRPYAGASVIDPDPAELDEIIELRRQAESFAIANAVLRGSSDLCDELTRIARELGHAFDQGEAGRVFDLDMAFHLAIAEASGHAVLVTVLRTLLPRLMLVWYPTTIQKHHTGVTFEDAHLDLVRPIADRDIAGAIASIDQHLETFYVDVGLRTVHQTNAALASIIDAASSRVQPLERVRGLR